MSSFSINLIFAQIEIPAFPVLELIAKGILWLLLCFIPLLAFFYLVSFLISLPLRRQERARFFLDLLEAGFRQGHTPERAIIAISHTRDRDLGVRFHFLAAQLQQGLSLNQGLVNVPGLLPPQISAMLCVGEKIGDVRKILPAARGLLRDGNSQVRSAFNYLIIILLAAAPIIPLVLFTFAQTVLPKYRQIFEGTLGEQMPLPPLTEFIIRIAGWSAAFQAIVAALLGCGIIFYIGGPRFRQWIQDGVAPFTDWIFFLLPWRRKRLQRDFCNMLALLLDAEVPETKAVQLAAQSTANQIFLRRAAKTVADLERGEKLPEALRRFDDVGEFSWRVANAACGGHGFFCALSGWIEALDAKAFQQEQAASQVITTSLVLVNGTIVGLIAVGFFQPLIALINRVGLW